MYWRRTKQARKCRAYDEEGKNACDELDGDSTRPSEAFSSSAEGFGANCSSENRLDWNSRKNSCSSMDTFLGNLDGFNPVAAGRKWLMLMKWEDLQILHKIYSERGFNLH